MGKKRFSMLPLLVVMNCCCPKPYVPTGCSPQSDLPACEGPYTHSVKTETHFPSYMSNVGKVTYYIPSNSDKPLPVIVLEPGFFSQSSNLEDVEKRYASHGFLVAGVVNTTYSDTMTINLNAYRLAMLQTVHYVIESSKDNGHFLFGLVDTLAIGVSGHSMGGGGALLACDSIGKVNGQSIRAAIFMNPYGKCGGQHIKVPVLFLSSEKDEAVDPLIPGGASTPENVFYSFQSIPAGAAKLFGIMKGMDHNAVVDKNPLLATSGNAELFLPTMVSWFKVFLAGDSSYRKYLDSTSTEFQGMKDRFTPKGEVPGYVYEGL